MRAFKGRKVMAFSFERHAHSPAAGKCRTATLNGSIGVLFQRVPQFDSQAVAPATVTVGTIVLQVGRCEGCSYVWGSAPLTGCIECQKT
jgi:hypothetical protein